ncbi:Villin-1 [Geodia barretti]|nr:Villin-1 [Geodia barretti]
MTSYKPRPVLSPSLFEGPPALSRDNSDVPSADHQSNTKKAKTEVEVDKPQEVSGMEPKPVRTEQRLSVAKETTHKASPIPKRAKFLRKFSKKGGKKKQQLPPVPAKKKEVESVVEEKMEREVEEKMEEGGREDVTAAGRELSLDTQQHVKEMKLAAMEAGTYTGGWEGRLSGSESGPYDMISEDLVQGALKDSLAAARGEIQLPPIKPSTPSPPPSPTLPTIPVLQPPQLPVEKHGPVKEKAVITKEKARKSLKTPDETVTVNFIPQSNIKKSFPVTHVRLLKEEDLSSPGESEDEATTRVDSSGFEKLDLQTFEEFGDNTSENYNEKKGEGEEKEVVGEEEREKREEEGKEAGKDEEEEEREAGEGEEGQGEQGNNSTEIEIEKKGTEEANDGEDETEKEGGTEGEETKGREELSHFKEVDTKTSEDMISTKNPVQRAASLDTMKPLELPPLKKWGDIQNLKQADELVEGDAELKIVLEEEEEEEEERGSEEGGRKLSVVPEENEDEDETYTKLSEHLTLTVESGASPNSSKQPDSREGDGSETEVLNRVTRMERERGSASGKGGVMVGEGVRRKGLDRVKIGSVSEKLKMFGGGRKVTRTVSDSSTKITTSSDTVRAATNGGGDETVEDGIAPLPIIEKRALRSNSEEKLRMDGLPSLSPPQQRANKTRSISSPPASPPLGRLQEGDETETTDGVARVSPTPSPAQLRRKSSTGVFSPLMISTDASSNRSKSENLEKIVETEPHLSQLVTPTSKTLEASIRDEKRWSVRDDRARRQLFALSAEGKVGSRESAYMGWASPPQLTQMKQRWEKEAGESVKKRVASLLRTPRLTGPQVPLEFRGLQPHEPGRLTVWRQKTGSLRKIMSPETINFEETDIFIFLKEPLHGPILHQVYLWLGRQASELSVSSVHQHCQQLMHCLPGGCPLHKEVQGHESGGFMSAIGAGVASKLAGSTPYVNASLETATLYNLNETFMTFQPMLTRPPSHSDLTTSPTPSVLDTHNRVWVWLPAGYWGNQTTRCSNYQKSVLDIGQVFLVQKGYPKWAPITVLTQHCETLQFVSLFTAWPNLNFDLAPPTFQPILKNLNLLELITPTVLTNPSDMKIYRVEGNERRPLPPVPSSHLSAGGVYMFQWTTCHASPLYTWVETSLCVWVGSRVADYWTAVESCTKHVEKEMPLMLVPSGQEPLQLLSFFKGTMVVHSSPYSSPHPSPLLSSPHRGTSSPGHQTTRLYQVSGSSLEHIKAMEVPPSSSSLCSTHCYILSSPPLLFSWSGHLSSEETRTGALYMAQILSSSQKPLLVAEGQEEEDFWKSLGGKKSYQHFDHQKFPNWSVPELYCCISSQSSLTFTQLPPAKKKDLKSNGCYILWLRNQLFVWIGGHWKNGSFTAVLKAYLSQCHSGRTARDFVVTVAHEGREGEGFWQWFELQRCLEPKAIDSSQDIPVVRASKEDETSKEAIPIVTTPTKDEAAPTGSGDLSESGEKVKGEGEGEGEEENGGERGEKGEDSSDEPVKDPSPPPTIFTEEATPTTEQETSVVETPTDLTTAVLAEAAVEKTDDGDNAEGGGAAEPGHVTPPTNQIAEDESMENLSLSSLLTQPEDLEEMVASKQKKRTKKASIKATKTVTVNVEVEGGRVITVTVREGAPVISVMFQVAKTAGLTLTPTSSLFEIVPQLRLQRLLEEHEVMKTVSSQWPTGKHRPRLLLTSFHSKNMLWETNPPIPQSSITAYLGSETFPELTNELFYSPRATRLQWKTTLFKLTTGGIYITSVSGVSQLYASLEHHLYTPTPTATISTPTRFCFALRPVSSWKLKDVKLFCCTDLQTMATWVHGMRLLQHGKQLRVNLQAMRLRLQKRATSNT